MREENKLCGNCGAWMEWNILLGSWECKYCGNVAAAFQNPWSRWPRLI